MRMSKIVFTFFFVIIGLSTLWVGGKFFLNLYTFLDLGQAQKIKILQWEVDQVKPGKFAVVAHFLFETSGEKYPSSFVFQKPLYTNPYTAQDLVEGWKQGEWWVWYNAKNPKKFSLQKSFPLKQGIYFLICLLLLFYFVWLYFYITRIYSGGKSS